MMRVSVPDSLEGIFITLNGVIPRVVRGESVDVDFSELRPEGCVVTDTSGTASGPTSFARVYLEAAKNIKTKQGSLTVVLRHDHPDVLKFADLAKEYLGSVAVSLPPELPTLVPLWHPYKVGKPDLVAREFLLGALRTLGVVA